jgi:hypothetical protein
MKIFHWYPVALVLGVWVGITWISTGSPLPLGSRPPAEVDQAELGHGRWSSQEHADPLENADPLLKAKFDQIKLGMTLAEVEAIMGPAGLSYSSQREVGYFIWKTRSGWIRVWLTWEDGVTSKGLDPHLTDKV